jgi:hypothetical protein
MTTLENLIPSYLYIHKNKHSYFSFETITAIGLISRLLVSLCFSRLYVCICEHVMLILKATETSCEQNIIVNFCQVVPLVSFLTLGVAMPYPLESRRPPI